MTRHLLSKFHSQYLFPAVALACAGAGAFGCSSSTTGSGYGSTAGVSGGSSAQAGGSAGTATSGGNASGGIGGGAAGAAGALASFSVTRTDLVSDQAGAAQTDPHLVDAWGIAINPTAQLFWLSSNGDGSTPVYGASGTPEPFDPKVAPISGTDPGSPTGLVFNDGNSFMSDKFIVDTEDGQILGWTGTGDYVQRAVKAGAGYKGLALIGAGTTQMLVATDFHDGTVDVYDVDYKPVTPGAFTDDTIPAGFAPFNVMPIGNQVYVTYAKQDADKADDEHAPGNGYVSVFGADGTFTKRLISGGDLNSPWAVAMAPASFGALANTLLVGNFGDGAIHAYDPSSGALVGQLTTAAGDPLLILGLWDLKVGPAGTTDLSNTLYFTAGPADESHGIFGKLEAVQAVTSY
ncbi:MAG TPA: TIGR03118 family protein [Polyangiaceae bacterium]|jgi:uncharacterized protein (TIGR03118 family)|nr:TIGR03118 family protein [Polyangiaceae bacterium]